MITNESSLPQVDSFYTMLNIDLEDVYHSMTTKITMTNIWSRPFVTVHDIFQTCMAPLCCFKIVIRLLVPLTCWQVTLPAFCIPLTESIYHRRRLCFATGRGSVREGIYSGQSDTKCVPRIHARFERISSANNKHYNPLWRAVGAPPFPLPLRRGSVHHMGHWQQLPVTADQVKWPPSPLSTR